MQERLRAGRCSGNMESTAMARLYQLFLKITEAGRRICPDGEEAPPYEGAKPYLLIDDIDDRGFMTRLVQAVYEELPEPKPKKTKRKEGQENGKNGL